MALKLYNTLTRKKELFEPIKKGNVSMYSCGPTVYSYQHIGNLRTYIFNDILKRILLFNKLKVNHVMNYTDVGHLTSDADEGEDKMEKAAAKEKKTAKEIASYYASVFEEDCKKLNILAPDKVPKATGHIKEQIEMIQSLEEKGFTYKTSDGIYFDSSKFKDYGILGRLNESGLKAGKRVDLGEKKSKTDFALWKFSPENEKRQQEWKSPFGIGFPGWHIECSAMSSKYLGKEFDIHTGGIDHVQVHHTNEIAQSECALGVKPWVRYWLHGEFLTFKGEKVSKSTGGLYTISDLEKLGFDAIDFRYLCLNTHYRKQLNFDLKVLEGAKNAHERLKNILLELKRRNNSNNMSLDEYKKEFLGFVNDDLNMPEALSVLWNVLRDEKLGSKEKLELVYEFDKVLGLNLKSVEEEKVPEEIQKLVAEREQARKDKDFKKADGIRKDLKNKGYLLEDSKEGILVKKN